MDQEREIYIGENGLEHCSACKEPTEEFFPENVQKLFGMKTHPRFCACLFIVKYKCRKLQTQNVGCCTYILQVIAKPQNPRNR